MGKIPQVLKIARQTNHPDWLFLAAFHIAKYFNTTSKIAKIQMITIKKIGIGLRMCAIMFKINVLIESF